MAETLVMKGVMKGHADMVTAIAAPIDNTDMIVTSSRDKSVLVWTLTKDTANSSMDPSTAIYGVPRRRLTGHSHFVQDVVLSSDGQFALSGSWDGELRLWDLNTGATTRRFVGHTKDVLSVAFSVDNRQIVSASRDRTIKLWNTLGECKYTIQDADGHSNWVSCVRFSPNILQPTIVSGSWDRTVKVWNLTNCKLRCTLAGHGGPNRYWLCAATQESVKIWDLESKSIVQDLKPTDAPQPTSSKKQKILYCSSLSWSSDGSTLFTGYSDGSIRVWEISRY
ncbi:uncharacterized protein A4U43_C01F32040 [Asparagus officinalis]|uniref:Uncharacterized protein n=1 Tax=Asparagus officinalis TaxID=4686 RepID=A0A5P1FTQ8_ASPOF|nr:uncharacterized protein A4U43_C01F32040 [Asparagus officinalis]